MRAAILTVLVAVATGAAAEVDRNMVNRIVDEGMQRSELPQLAHESESTSKR